MPLRDEDKIDLATWEAALAAARRPGMGDIKLVWHPYEHLWMVTISFSCSTQYKGAEVDINQALAAATALARADEARRIRTMCGDPEGS